MTDQPDPASTGVDRRHLLAGGIGAAGVLGLAACGDGSTGATEDPVYGGGPAVDTSTATAGDTPSTSEAGAGATRAAGPALIAVADVPVGGAASAKDAEGKPIIVAQPEAGTIVAFSAVCTHNGCTVAPAGSRIACPCHQSSFAIADGARLGGPAQQPLAPVAVTVVDGEVVPA